MKDLIVAEEFKLDFASSAANTCEGVTAAHVHAGPGACRSCGCKGFRSTPKKDDVCGDCGHYWQVHR